MRARRAGGARHPAARVDDLRPAHIVAERDDGVDAGAEGQHHLVSRVWTC